jgi:soluble lytic murein transglycosylase-like protein
MKRELLFSLLVVGAIIAVKATVGVKDHPVVEETNKSIVKIYYNDTPYEVLISKIEKETGWDYSTSKLIVSESSKNGVKLDLALAVAKIESGYNAKAYNRNVDGSVDRGIFQINSNSAPILAQDLIREGVISKKYDLYDPSVNIKMGCYYLGKLKQKYNSDSFVVLAYNKGEVGALRVVRSGQMWKQDRCVQVKHLRQEILRNIS